MGNGRNQENRIMNRGRPEELREIWIKKKGKQKETLGNKVLVEITRTMGF